MSAGTDAGDSPAAASLHDNAIQILLYLKTQEEERASTTAIRDATGLSAANISGHHAVTLIEEGYIEKTGKEPGDAPRDANVYTLTHRGRKEANNLLNERQAPMSKADMIRHMNQLQDRVDELEAMVDEPRAESGVDDDLLDQVETNSELVEEHEKRLEKHWQYLDRILDSLDKVSDKVQNL